MPLKGGKDPGSGVEMPPKMSRNPIKGVESGGWGGGGVGEWGEMGWKWGNVMGGRCGVWGGRGEKGPKLGGMGKNAPKRLQMAPKWPQNGPKCPQKALNGPKMSPKCPQMAPNGLKMD